MNNIMESGGSEPIIDGLDEDGIKRKLFEHCISILMSNAKDVPESFDVVESQVYNCTYLFLNNISEVRSILMTAELDSTPIMSNQRRHMWLTLSNILWWYLAVTSSVTLLLYGYFLKDLLFKKEMHKQTCLFAIISSDFIMLVFFAFGVLIGGNLTGPAGNLTCKFIMYSTNSSAFFTNWCWVILWGHKYMAIYHPLRHLRQYRRRQMKIVLLTLFLVACICESWTLILASQKTVDGVTYCDVDLGLAHHWIFSWVALTEVIVSFFFPFAIIMAADVAVLIKAYRPTLIKQGTVEELNSIRHIRHGKRKRYSSCPPDPLKELEVDGPSSAETSQDNMKKILHPLYRERQLRRKMRSILRCTLTGSLDLLLNLPLYVYEISDNFISFKVNYREHWKVHAVVGSIAYMLYFLQFPLIIFYVRNVLISKQSSSDKPTRKSTVVQTASEHEQHAIQIQRPIYMRHQASELQVSANAKTKSVLINVRERETSVICTYSAQ